MVLVNTGSKLLKAKLTGTGTVSITERGVYPAADGVTDVELDIEVTNLTVGVHAQYITAYSSANVPKRWKGYVYAHDIVGTTGASEGYAVLLSPAERCTLNIKAKNIKRHAAYLSAGAQHNDIYIDVDTCGNVAVQLYSTAAQAETSFNRIRGSVSGLYQTVAGQAAACWLVQKANHNDVAMKVVGNNATDYAFVAEGGSGGPYPAHNSFHNSDIYGQFIGTSIVRLLNAESTSVIDNNIEAYSSNAAAHVIAVRRSGTNGVTHAGFIQNNKINGMAQTMRGYFYTEANTQPTLIENNDYRNATLSIGPVEDSSSGYRQGFNRKFYGSTTITSVVNASTKDAAITLPESVQITPLRVATANITSWSLSSSASLAVYPLNTSATVLTLRAFNGHTVTQDLTVGWSVMGD